MSLIYSSFAQIQENQLPGLIGEYTALMDYFNSKKIKERIDFKVAYGKTINELTSDIIQHQKNLRVFHFSGHSDHDGLDFEEEDFDKDHFSDFFNTLNYKSGQIDCVFLNGCSNATTVQQLSTVPVVIGSKSPILNKDAIKFTSDFFAALISGKKSYQDAFNQAFSALPDSSGQSSVIRGLGRRGLKPLLNDYFMVINNDKVAERGIPLKRNWRRWVLTLLIFLAVLAATIGGIWTYLHMDDIKDEARGYACPEWNDEDKCNILVADFNVDEANSFITEGINNNDLLNQFLEANYVNSFKELVDNKQLDEENYPKQCGFEYLLTGVYQASKNEITIELRPRIETKQVTQELQIEDIFELRKMILTLDDIHNNNFIISKLCVACASKDESMLHLVEEWLDLMEGIPEAEEKYQQTAEEAATIAMGFRDTTKAISFLEKMAFVNYNDKTLAAHEGKSMLEIETRQYKSGYYSLSNYISGVENRINSPQNFIMSKPQANYIAARHNIMARRAMLVFDHPNQLGFANEQAISDFRYLQKIGNNQLYENQIKELCKRIGSECGFEEAKPVVLKIRNTDGGGAITNAIAQYNSQQFTANNRGLISIPCLDDKCIGKLVKITANGFKDVEKRIERKTQGQRIKLDPKPETRSETKLAKINIFVEDADKKIIRRSHAVYNDKTHRASPIGIISIPCAEDNCIGKPVKISASGYESKQVSLRRMSGGMKVQLDKIPDTHIAPELSIKILITDSKGKGIKGAIASFNNEDYVTDTKGIATIPCRNNSCIEKRLIVSAVDYQEKTTIITHAGMVVELRVNAPEYSKTIGFVKDENQRPIRAADIGINNTRLRSDAKGEFVVECDVSKYNSTTIQISKSGYEPQQLTVAELREIKTVILKTIARSSEQTYTIGGTIRDCDFKNSIASHLIINDQTVKVTNIRNGSFYKHEIKSQAGAIVTVKPPSGFRFSDNRSMTFDLSSETKIEKNLILLEDKPLISRRKNYTVNGQILYEGKPAVRANVSISGSGKSVPSNGEGVFKLTTPDFLCRFLEVDWQGEIKKRYELRRYMKGGNIEIIVDLAE